MSQSPQDELKATACAIECYDATCPEDDGRGDDGPGHIHWVEVGGDFEFLDERQMEGASSIIRRMRKAGMATNHEDVSS